MPRYAGSADVARLRAHFRGQLETGKGQELFLAVTDTLETRIKSKKLKVRTLRSHLSNIAHWSRQSSVIVGELYDFEKAGNGSRMLHEKELLVLRARYRLLRGSKSRLEGALCGLDALSPIESDVADCDLIEMGRFVSGVFDSWEALGRAKYPKHPAKPKKVDAKC